uniref:Thiamine pyrophosphate-binding protein n=2 Tax=Cohnella candidum TaxID=2674991 RepID=A0A3G3JVY2_9BACL|nr:thiamine pyrophosphate-binding protein [Cohnella candidum]
MGRSGRMTTMTVSEAILEQLRFSGVERIYGVVGDAIFGLLDAIAKQSSIRWISVKHESVAAFMASADAKCTGKLAVCAAQMGPGLTNLLNGLGDAYMDGYPVLAITGQAPVRKIGTDYKQLINQQELAQALTGFSQLAVHPDAVIPALSAAITTSLTAGTVSHLSIPADLFTLQTLSKPCAPIQVSMGQPDPAMLSQTLQTMRSAKRPMILAGQKAKPASEEIKQLAMAWGSGVVSAYAATGVIPDDFPLALGGLGEGGNPYVTGRFKEADVVLAIGTTWWPEGQTPTNARVIRIAGHETELRIGPPAETGMVGDVAAVVSQLAEALKSHPGDAEWRDQIQRCKQIWANQNETEGRDTEVPLHPSNIVRMIEKHVSPDAIIALDEGDSTLWFMRNFRAQHQRTLFSERWRTMGFGLPAAMAAKLVDPQRQVVCLTGDGGLGMVLADLLTAARYELPITMIVCNNGTLQMERNKMAKKGLIREGTEVANPDYVKLADACGWKGYRIQSAAELENLLHASKVSTHPTLIDVPTSLAVYPDYPTT